MKDQIIEKIYEHTKEGKIKWTNLSTYTDKNDYLVKYIEQNIHSSERIGAQVTKYRPYFDNMHLKVSSSFFSVYKGGTIFLFYYYQPRPYVGKTLTERIQASRNIINIILAVQPDDHSEIEEINTVNDENSYIIGLYNLASDEMIENSDKLKKFLNTLLE